MKKKTNIYNPDGNYMVLRSFGEEDLEILSQHNDVMQVNAYFGNLNIPNLDFLLKCPKIERLHLSGHKVSDYSALERMPNLKNLSLNIGYGKVVLENFDFLCELHSLEQISIHYFSKPFCFPNLQKLEKLISVRIYDCTAITDISNISLIPNLQGFEYLGKKPLVVEDLEFIAKKDGMKVMSAEFGRVKMNKAFNAMIKEHGLINGLIVPDGSISPNLLN